MAIISLNKQHFYTVQYTETRMYEHARTWFILSGFLKHYSELKVDEEINKVYHGWISSFRRGIFRPSLVSSSVTSSPIGLLKQEIKTIVIQGPNYRYFKLNFSKSLLFLLHTEAYYSSFIYIHGQLFLRI